MTKQLKRLNIQPEGIAIRPIASSGHRYVNKIMRSNKISYYVYVKKRNNPRTFRVKKLALCYKFIILLKIKSNII